MARKRVKLRFTKKQRDGLGQLLDTINAASIITLGTYFGGKIDLSLREVFELVGVSILLLVTSFLLRKG
ncbi:MAG: hypothetical protein QM537_05240 [Candidatus Symbiobacter sp.]|nr:hypothetical protein [Candidatus Symbiobacter sp.]